MDNARFGEQRQSIQCDQGYTANSRGYSHVDRHLGSSATRAHAHSGKQDTPAEYRLCSLRSDDIGPCRDKPPPIRLNGTSTFCHAREEGPSRTPTLCSSLREGGCNPIPHTRTQHAAPVFPANAGTWGF